MGEPFRCRQDEKYSGRIEFRRWAHRHRGQRNTCQRIECYWKELAEWDAWRAIVWSHPGMSVFAHKGQDIYEPRPPKPELSAGVCDICLECDLAAWGLQKLDGKTMVIRETYIHWTDGSCRWMFMCDQCDQKIPYRKGWCCILRHPQVLE